MRLIRDVGAWLDRRLQLGTPLKEAAEHRVPRSSASWFYVFGSGALALFVTQIVTGICLALACYIAAVVLGLGSTAPR